MTRRAGHRRGHSAGGPPGEFRIIAGRWRGRRLPVVSRVDLRPTPDRVRETVFNWLAPWLSGARCLDLFAGTGALGLEALSRGAATCEFVDIDRVAGRALEEALDRLAATGGRVLKADVAAYLEGSGGPFDLVFVDPPYHAGLLQPVCERLQQGWLAPAAHVYLEAPVRDGPPPLPPGWTLEKSASAGQVGYHLARFDGPWPHPRRENP